MILVTPEPSNPETAGFVRALDIPLRSIIAVVVIIWLAIGVAAAYQRHYFSSSQKPTCATTSTSVVTVIAGPLNYIGVNPKIKCKAPEPSK